MADDADTTVKYKPEDADAEAGKVEIKSPAKNRYKGTKLMPEDGKKPREPFLFERAATSWWDPKFDSPLLESQHQKNYFSQYRRRFQYALIYIVVACIAWAIFFYLTDHQNWIPFLAGAIVCLIFSLATFAFTFVSIYQRFYQHTSAIFTVVLCAFLLLNFVYEGGIDLTPVGSFTGTVAILVLLYTVIPLPLYACIAIGVSHSILFEILNALRTSMRSWHFIIARILLHICIHIIGIHIFMISQARKRSTFLKVGQSIMTRKELEIEKALKSDMINSLMPAQVAKDIMKSREEEGEKDEEEDDDGRRPSQQGKIKFRNFHMSQLENVSILFADIVGFTKMSSGKQASHLVALLNDLFGRFDIICDNSGCEKISTLGDCYYCVCGCPEAREDHAHCCIKMGVLMCKAIQQFDIDHNEEVNMRVGVHTGTVLCGLVGTRRFKFDVWSNDVTLANTMESEGEPGKVHISESTLAFVKDDYEFEPHKEVPGE